MGDEEEENERKGSGLSTSLAGGIRDMMFFELIYDYRPAAIEICGVSKKDGSRREL